MIDLIKSSKPSWSRWYFKVYLTTSTTGFRNCIAVQLLLYGWYTAYFILVWVFSENFSVKLQEEKERENICYYTCDVFQHVKNQLELMTWNWIIPSIPIACAKILLILYVQKKSWKFRMVSANASCSPGVLTSFLDQLQKDTIWL